MAFAYFVKLFATLPTLVSAPYHTLGPIKREGAESTTLFTRGVVPIRWSGVDQHVLFPGEVIPLIQTGAK